MFATRRKLLSNKKLTGGKTMKKWFALALAAMMMLATLTGCGGTESGDAGDSQQTQETEQGQSSSETDTVVYPEIPAKTGSLTIGISTNALSNIHNRHMFEGLREEAEGRGHTVVTANANGDPTQQANDIENLVQAGCDVIVVQNADNFSLKNARNSTKKQHDYLDKPIFILIFASYFS